MTKLKKFPASTVAICYIAAFHEKLNRRRNLVKKNRHRHKYKSNHPKELEGLMSPKKLAAIKQFAEDMQALGYRVEIPLRRPAGVPLDAIAIDFVPIDDKSLKH